MRRVREDILHDLGVVEYTMPIIDMRTEEEKRKDKGWEMEKDEFYHG